MDRKKVFHILRRFSIALGSLLLVAALFLLWLSVAFESKKQVIKEPAQVKHRVLFLCAYNPLYFTYQDQSAGLIKGLYPNGIEYDVDYMDTKNFPTREDGDQFYEFIKNRISRSDYEAVILGDDDAVVFALEYREELFKDLPMVFFGVNEIELARKACKEDGITGFYELVYFEETLSTAVSMFPDKKTLVSLHDNSAAGKEDVEIFYSFKDRYKDYRFIDIDTSKLDEQELAARLRELDDDVILFFMTGYTDKTGKVRSVYDMLSTINSCTGAPVFRNYSGGREEGVIGGTYMDFTEQAYRAALIVSDVLNNGADINSYKLDESTPSISEYSYPAIKKHGANPNLVPKDAIVLDAPVGVLEGFGERLPMAVLLFCSLCFFVMAGNLGVKALEIANKEILESKDEISKSQEKLKFQVEHDDFLGIFNRRYTIEYLGKVFDENRRYSVVMADIDNFKSINESYGHEIADQVLFDLSKRLERLSFERNWIIGRYGGDEFLIVVPDVWLNEGSLQINALVNEFSRAITIGEETIMMFASFGVANSDGKGLPKDYVMNAEVAMFEAKERGKNMVFVYTDETKDKIKQENAIKSSFQEAFNNDGFYMVYQPKVEAGSKKVVGYEALVRMKDKNYGPATFVPIIEKNGWIPKLGRLTTKLVVEQLYKWRKEGYEILPVSINFSSKQVNDVGYVGYLNGLLREYGIPSKYVQIEITESLFMDNNAQADKLFKELKKMGIKLLMDDFGTGYSSLGYLTYMPIDEIKLDKSFVDSYLDKNDSFIKDVIMLSHDIDKTIVIEGVEEKWQYEKLCQLDADVIQGFYFSRPLSEDEAIVFKPQD